MTLEQLEALNPEEMGREELLALLDALEACYAEESDREPPEDAEEEAVIAWEERLERLDDLTDDVRDLLEEADPEEG